MKWNTSKIKREIPNVQTSKSHRRSREVHLFETRKSFTEFSTKSFILQIYGVVLFFSVLFNVF